MPTTTNASAPHTHPCMLILQRATIMPATCPVASHTYMANLAAENAASAERRAETTHSARQRAYSLERAAYKRQQEADSLRWAAEATCTA